MPTITQAMILAAGKGTRLRPLTLQTPKPLVAVGGQPLIVWHIKALQAAGITDITINVSWLADKLIQALGDGSQYGVTLHWSVEDVPLETAGGISQALRSGKLQDAPFIVVSSDVWTTYDFSQLQHCHLADGQLAHLLLVNNPEHNSHGDFALDNGLASEQVVGAVATYTFSGISVMSPRIVAGLASGQAAPLAPLLRQGMAHSQITAEVISDYWVDVGTLERLEQTNAFIKNDKNTGASRHKGA